VERRLRRHGDGVGGWSGLSQGLDGEGGKGGRGRRRVRGRRKWKPSGRRISLCSLPSKKKNLLNFFFVSYASNLHSFCVATTKQWCKTSLIGSTLTSI
jgi:hypothetical protein